MITTLILTIIIALIMYLLKPLFFKDKSEQSQSEIRSSSTYNIANVNPKSDSDSLVQDNSSILEKKPEEQKRKKSWIERNYWMLPVGIAIFLLKMCSDMMPNA